MPERNFDFVVLGGGSAGYAAARTAADLGLSVAVVDGAETLGGLCILRGCMPSKTLIESANRARTIRRAPEFGLRSGLLEVHGPEIIARKRQLIGEFAQYRQDQLHSGKFELIRGMGRYRSGQKIEIQPLEGEAYVIGAQTSLIATGSKVFAPSIEGLEDTGYLTSDDVLELEKLPRSIAVLGGGAIALEMAHYLEALGCQVTLIQRSKHVLSDQDTDVSEVVEGAFRERGMQVICGTQLQKIEAIPEGKRIIFEHEGKALQVVTDDILLALGRKPALDSLNLEVIGLESGKLMSVDSRQMTQAPGVFAAGDVSGPLEVVHLAIEQGEVAAHNAAVFLSRSDGPPKELDYRLKLFGVFSDPEVAVVGLSENELRDQGRDYIVAKEPFDDHGKSMVMGETHGFVKLIADPQTKELLGASVVGPHAVDLIHEVVVAMHFKATAGDLARIPHYHPTLSEIWTYPAEELAEK